MLARLRKIMVRVQFDCLFSKIMSCSTDQRIFTLNRFLNSESVLQMKINYAYHFNVSLVLSINNLISHGTKF
jgi:hypothetical protein